MATQDEIERARFRAQITAKNDEKNIVNEAFESARQDGMEMGYESGRILACQKFLKQAQTPRQELAALSIVELRTKADELEKQAKEAMAKRHGS